MFTNVPFKDAIAIAKDLLPQSCFLDKDAFEKLLTLCSVDTVFQFNQKYFVQKDGVAMGSPVAPLLANIYLYHLEKSLPDIGVNIKLWKRYVYDVIAIVDSNYEAEKLLTSINKWSSTLHFTIETEDNDGTLNFQDLKLQYSYMERCYSASVYIKATNTTLMGDFHALSPTSHKVSTLMSLLNRAYTHSSSWSSFAVEIDRIEKLMTKNAYPTKFVSNLPLETLLMYASTVVVVVVAKPMSQTVKSLSQQFRGSATQIVCKKNYVSLVNDVRTSLHNNKGKKCFWPTQAYQKTGGEFQCSVSVQVPSM